MTSRTAKFVGSLIVLAYSAFWGVSSSGLVPEAAGTSLVADLVMFVILLAAVRGVFGAGGLSAALNGVESLRGMVSDIKEVQQQQDQE